MVFARMVVCLRVEDLQCALYSFKSGGKVGKLLLRKGKAGENMISCRGK